jgi:hypothetical protein
LAAHQKPAALARRAAALVPVLWAAQLLLAAATAAAVLPALLRAAGDRPAPLRVRALALTGSVLQPQAWVRAPQRLALRAV